MGLGVGVVLLVRVGEVGAEPGGCERSTGGRGRGGETHRSLRSTGERLSNLSFGSLRMAFQLPTPHCGAFRGGIQGAIDGRTVLQPSTSICVSSSDHFLRCFFCTTKASSASLRILPLRSGMVMEVSSRKFQAGTRRGEEGRARDTRRACLGGESDMADNPSTSR